MKKKKTKRQRTITVRLDPQQHAVLKTVCALRRQSQTGFLTKLATEQASKELLKYAVDEYIDGRASISELAAKTQLDVTALMDAIAVSSQSSRQNDEAFLAAARAVAEASGDREFYEVARRALIGAATR